MQRAQLFVIGLPLIIAATVALQGNSSGPRHGETAAHAARLAAEGREIFRYETFGDEAFWGDALQLHRAVAGAAHGGVGPGISPRSALGVGLKVDITALPHPTRNELRKGRIDLDDPAVTLELLREDAVVGLAGRFDSAGGLASIGITCALCHSTVDDSFAHGIGRRRDGWPNRDLDIGTIVSLAPNLAPIAQALGASEATTRQVLRSWGPGRFDAHLFLDGKAQRPDGKSASVLIPAAFGLGGVDLATYEGWGSVSYWNAFVATLEMHGRGTLFDPRLDDATRHPLAAAARLGHTRSSPDLVTEKLHALQAYQLALPVPQPASGSFDARAAARGQQLFEGPARCAECHVPPLYTEPGHALHDPAEIGIDSFQADRGPHGKYRTTPLRGLFTRTKGGFYHDGRFPTLGAVVDHYDRHFLLGMNTAQKNDLLQFLKSL